MVRASATFLARPGWYDRNPINRHQRYLGTGITPHTATERWTYTVGANKKAWLELLIAQVQRATAATTAGIPQVSIFFTPSGGSETSLVWSWERGNAVGNKCTMVASGVGILGSGDIIRSTTFDDSTGGTMDYAAIAKITEFDA